MGLLQQPVNYSTAPDVQLDNPFEKLQKAQLLHQQNQLHNLQAESLKNQNLLDQKKMSVIDNQLADEKLKKDRLDSYHQDISTVLGSDNFDEKAYLDILAKYPEFSKDTRTQMSEARTVSDEKMLDTLWPIYSSLKSGNTELAKNILESQKTAYINAGKPENADNVDRIIKLIDLNKNVALASMSKTIYSTEKGKGLFKMEKEVADTDKTLADTAQSKSTTAKIDAETKEVALNAKVDRDTKIMNAKSQATSASAAWNSSVAARENAKTNAGELSLKRDEFISKKDEKTVKEAQTYQGTLQRVGDLIKNAAWLVTPDKAGKTQLDKYAGSYAGLVPKSYMSGEDAKTFRNRFDQIKGDITQMVITEMKNASANGTTGFGAMNQKELEVVQAKVATLDPTSNPKQLQKEILSIVSDLHRMKKNAEDAYYKTVDVGAAERAFDQSSATLRQPQAIQPRKVVDFNAAIQNGRGR